MNKPTSGKWRKFGRHVICKGRFLAVAHCIGDRDYWRPGFMMSQEPEQDMNEAQANAQIMAASKDLLAALQAMLECSWPTGQDTRTDRAMKQARAAIAKATGGQS